MKKSLLFVLSLLSVISVPLSAIAHERDTQKAQCTSRALKQRTAAAAFVNQVTVCPEVLSFRLEPGQEVPPTNSTAAGSCVGLVASDRTNVTVTCTHNVVDANGAHIHTAPVGVNGPILCPAANANSPFTISCSLDADQRAALEAGNLYVNVHSPAFPNGEIRGQIPVPGTLTTPVANQNTSQAQTQSGPQY